MYTHIIVFFHLHEATYKHLHNKNEKQVNSIVQLSFKLCYDLKLREDAIVKGFFFQYFECSLKLKIFAYMQCGSEEHVGKRSRDGWIV